MEVNKKREGDGLTSIQRYDTKRKHSFLSKSNDDVVPTKIWFLLTLMIALIGLIPIGGAIINLVLLLVMSFTDINDNLKNWAKANFVWVLISLVLGLMVGISIMNVLNLNLQ